MMSVAKTVAILLLPLGAAHRGRLVTKDSAVPQLHRASLASIPVRMYSEDCWKPQPLRRTALNQQGAQVEDRLPGAGMDLGSLPLQKVLKDGFFEISCAKDFLLNHGDKFGDGKDTYTLGDVSNVSIVHYESIVVKEDREPMTQEVCFKFCRTVPDMLTFGIHNGRDCYCAPFFKPMESDSTSCDAVCEGNPTQMCGGKFKSSVFEMHQCADTAAELQETSQKASTVASALDKSVAGLKTVASGMQTTAVALQQSLGNVGDSAAAALMQDAKVTAGELTKAVNKSEELSAALAKSISEASGMAGGSVTGLDATAKAEALTATLEKLSAKAEDATDELAEQTKVASPTGPSFNSANASEQYYPLMYFVDKKFVKMPSTCTGKPVVKPMAGTSMDECAYACDAEIHDCVGFSHFAGSPSLCFLFSKFTEVRYYTNCGGTFLQQGAAGRAGPSMACMAKLSKFDGTKVKPDGSGKCDGCLKKAEKADRCPSM